MSSNPDSIMLDAVEARVLGALVEKEITTPDYYPLSLNALVNACNQTSNREPVTAYDEAAVKRALESLRTKRLAFVFAGASNRVTKYGDKFAETLGLAPPEVAVLCVLLLRGPQTVGELRGRTGRLHPFADLTAVESTLQALATRTPQPLVVRLPRQTGFKESRFAQLLSAPPATGPAEAAEPIAGAAAPTDDDRVTRLETEVTTLRRELTAVQDEVAAIKRRLE